MKKAVVTGATGAVGTALVKKLIDEGVETLVLVRQCSNIMNISKSPLVKICQCGLNELQNFDCSEYSGFDAFFHLGWSGTYGADRDNVFLQTENIKATLDAVTLAKKLDCKVFVGVGSQAENGVLPQGEKVAQTSAENPTSGYGIAKLTAGKISRILANQLGIKHIWCRILSAYGIGDKPHTLIMSTIKKFLNGEDCDFTLGEQQWDYIYSGDVANALFIVANCGKDGKIYPIGSGTSKSLKEYINIIHKITNSTSKCNFGAIDYYENQVMYLVADISALQKDTGFKPQTSFEEGISKTVLWCKGIKREEN